MAQAPAAPAEPAQIVVSATVRSKCDVPDTSSEAPQFDFDDTSLRPRGMGILDTVAQCMREGSLKGEQVTIVGHTDPRGSEDYNRQLGMLRAEAARDYLTAKGVPAEAVAVKSRGEQDATGEQAGEWQLDRRVEIQQTAEGSP
jgi:outer membrane protein OmpA-like peptidoglycan-associated protein